MPDVDLPTVIFALVALFVVFKLRSVLGMRSDSDRPAGGLLAPLRRAPGPAASVAQVEAAQSGPSAPAPASDRWKGFAEPDAWSGLDAIAAADRTFTPEGFLSGARGAYEIVVHGFAAGDSAALRGLMAPDAFANFDNAIRARAAAGHTMSTTVVAIDGATIVSAALAGANALVGVRFASKLASVVRDGAGQVVEGSPTAVSDHLDLWTFGRDVRSRDPNWQLTATQAER